MTRKRKRMGRPPKPAHEVRELFFRIRVSTDEMAAFVQAAENANGGEVSTWARNILRAVAGMKPERKSDK